MDKVKTVLKSPIAYIMAVLAVVRIVISVLLGVWFPAGQVCDDSLVMEYADLFTHFHNPNRNALLKTMGYPIFVKVVSVSKIPYTIWLGVLWVMAALFVFFLVKRMAGKVWLSFIAYVYVLFMPQAFDFWSGTRLYRTAIIAPFVLVLLCLLIHMILDAREGGFKLLPSVMLGLWFSYTYYLKEDGLWLMACLVFAILISVGFIIFNHRKNPATFFKRTVVLILPIVIFFMTTLGYKAVNYHYFKVFEINTRTESSYGEFMEYVYNTDSPNRSLYVWAPYDAIDSVFEASKTLSSYPELLEAIHNSVWAEDVMGRREIPGDHFAFALREEMFNIGMYESEEATLALFTKVNEELAEAFKSGRLKEADGVVQLLASTGGYTWEEVKGLGKLVKESFLGAVWLKGYQLGLGYVSDWEIENLSNTISFAKGMTHIDYLDDYSVASERAVKMAKVLSPLLMVYKLINAILFIALFSVSLYEFVKIIVNIKSIKTFSGIRCRIVLEALAALSLLGISVCYAFSISWFCAFCFMDGINMTILNFYNIALPGLLTLAYIFTILIIRDEISLVRDSKKGD